MSGAVWQITLSIIVIFSLNSSEIYILCIYIYNKGVRGGEGMEGFHGKIGETGPRGFEGSKGVIGLPGEKGTLGLHGHKGLKGKIRAIV